MTDALSQRQTLEQALQASISICPQPVSFESPCEALGRDVFRRDEISDWANRMLHEQGAFELLLDRLPTDRLRRKWHSTGRRNINFDALLLPDPVAQRFHEPLKVL